MRVYCQKRGEDGGKGTMTIKTIIRLMNDMVMVFDAEGEQIPEYQGQYEDVKASILRDAPVGAIFNHWFDTTVVPMNISRETW